VILLGFCLSLFSLPLHAVSPQPRALQTSDLLNRRRHPRILLSCGEASGDLYAGALTRELRAAAPDVVVSGLGGPEFAAAGGQVLEDYRGLSVTGLTEALAKAPAAAAISRNETVAITRK